MRTEEVNEREYFCHVCGWHKALDMKTLRLITISPGVDPCPSHSGGDIDLKINLKVGDDDSTTSRHNS